MQHEIDKLVIGEISPGKAQLLIRLDVFAQQIAHGNPHVCNQPGQFITRRWVLKIENNFGFRTAVADHLQRIARRAAGRIVVEGDMAHIRYSLQCEGET